MELLALCWVLLAGTLLSTSATSSALHDGDLDPIEIEMNMAPDSFDDQYVGCENQMKTKIQKVNRTEIKNNKDYANTWKKAAAEWQKICQNPNDCPKLKMDLAIAVVAYSAADGMCEKFNADTRQGGLSHQHYMQSYHFKTLHFLLTQALQALRKSNPKPDKCYNVYRGVQGIRFTAEKGKAVRFGQFTSASLDKNAAKEFGKDTFFEIQTCHGVSINPLSFFPSEEEVLIPPFEVFEVTKFSIVKGRNEIKLLSNDTKSNHNCELLNDQGGQWGRGHQEVGLGLSHGPPLPPLPCPKRARGGWGHRG
ncbi:NAD(P)(+)--arginine ADP-ribosyltransferase 1-like [Lagopus muta]|uniref:NAD(P)(+)--arginine ADP-ribosyltransferase 1-like n=1 Tax=Lagopus muta TaxID=64668 RepID=UPI0020A08129|nr:NAD(P)(+)--arginine ADP-ribosyltransferase 1-like [Lagopus muta]